MVKKSNKPIIYVAVIVVIAVVAIFAIMNMQPTGMTFFQQGDEEEIIETGDKEVTEEEEEELVDDETPADETEDEGGLWDWIPPILDLPPFFDPCTDSDAYLDAGQYEAYGTCIDTEFNILNEDECVGEDRMQEWYCSDSDRCAAEVVDCDDIEQGAVCYEGKCERLDLCEDVCEFYGHDGYSCRATTVGTSCIEAGGTAHHEGSDWCDWSHTNLGHPDWESICCCLDFS